MDESTAYTIGGQSILPTTGAPDPAPAPAPEARGGAGRPAPFPCHKINNCDKVDGENVPADLLAAWASVAKGAYSLERNALAFCDQVGLERVGFLTLTTPDHLSYWSKEGWREACRRYHNFSRRAIPDIFGAGARWVKVIEPMKQGRIHWHLMVECPGDIRTGFDFPAVASGDYRSASPLLRGIWADLRRRCKAYGMGRSELLPIRKSGEAVSLYVGKYLAKSASKEWGRGMLGQSRPKNGRRVAYSQGWRVSTSNFAWVSSGRLWRAAVGDLCLSLGLSDMSTLRYIYGANWGYKLAPLIVERYIEKTERAKNEKREH